MKRPSTNKMSMLMDALDTQSKKIVWHLRCRGHARLSELTGLIGASADMETLFRLKEIINPAAVKILGGPLLEFHKSRIDGRTGKRLLFNWWLTDLPEEERFGAKEHGKPLTDIFDEEDRIVIVSEVSPSLRLGEGVEVEQRHGILSITIMKIRQA